MEISGVRPTYQAGKRTAAIYFTLVLSCVLHLQVVEGSRTVLQTAFRPIHCSLEIINTDTWTLGHLGSNKDNQIHYSSVFPIRNSTGTIGIN